VGREQEGLAKSKEKVLRGGVARRRPTKRKGGGVSSISSQEGYSRELRGSTRRTTLGIGGNKETQILGKVLEWGGMEGRGEVHEKSRQDAPLKARSFPPSCKSKAKISNV